MNSNAMYFVCVCLIVFVFHLPLYALQDKGDKGAILEEEVLPAESPQYSVLYADVPHAKLKPKKPLTELPARKITDKYFITTRIDTLSIGYRYDSIERPRAFSYKPSYEEFGQLVVIERTHDWLVLDWSHFKLAAPAGLKMSWIDLDGKGSPELMFSMVNDVNVEQILGTRTSPVTGIRYNTHSHWKKAKGFAILNIDELYFVVDHVYTGYEYSYEQSRYVQGRKNEGTGYVYPDSYDTDREQKTMLIWYDFKISEGKNEIHVQQTECHEEMISDASKQYVIKKTQSEPHQQKTDYSKTKCIPMYVEGVYIFRDGKFVKQ